MSIFARLGCEGVTIQAFDLSELERSRTVAIIRGYYSLLRILVVWPFQKLCRPAEADYRTNILLVERGQGHCGGTEKVLMVGVATEAALRTTRDNMLPGELMRCFLRGGTSVPKVPLPFEEE